MRRHHVFARVECHDMQVYSAKRCPGIRRCEKRCVRGGGVSIFVFLIKGARNFQFERIVKALEEKTHSTFMEVNFDKRSESAVADQETWVSEMSTAVSAAAHVCTGPHQALHIHGFALVPIRVLTVVSDGAAGNDVTSF